MASELDGEEKGKRTIPIREDVSLNLLDCGSMAPSTDQFLYYIYGKGSAVTLLLILVNATLISATLLLACAFCMKSKQLDLLKNKSRIKRPHSELKKVIILQDIQIQGTNVKENGAISTGAEVKSEENNKTASSAVRGSVKSESGNPDLLRRVLPPPPGAPPPAPSMEDHLYDSVKDMRAAPSHNHDAAIAPDKRDSSTLIRTNPLYVSADEMIDPPPYEEAISPVPTIEANKRDEDSKTQVVAESLYAVIRKQPSVKTQNAENSASQKVDLLEEINISNQTSSSSTSSKEKPSKSQSPSDKVDSMLNNCKKRGAISVQPPAGDKTVKPPAGDKTVNGDQQAPPLVPVKRFDIEREFEQYTIEEETEIDKEPPVTT